MKSRPNSAFSEILGEKLEMEIFEPIIFSKISIHTFATTNRLISEKIVSWDFVPPFDFVAQFLASRAARRGEQVLLSTSNNLRNPVLWPILNNARTNFERGNG